MIQVIWVSFSSPMGLEVMVDIAHILPRFFPNLDTIFIKWILEDTDIVVVNQFFVQASSRWSMITWVFKRRSWPQDMGLRMDLNNHPRFILWVTVLAANKFWNKCLTLATPSKLVTSPTISQLSHSFVRFGNTTVISSTLSWSIKRWLIGGTMQVSTKILHTSKYRSKRRFQSIFGTSFGTKTTVTKEDSSQFEPWSHRKLKWAGMVKIF